MVFWHWLVIGFALAAAEMLTPGAFFFLFFGLSGIVVGLVLLFGAPLVTWMQVALFGVLALINLGLIRGPIARRFALGSSNERTRTPDDLQGEIAIVQVAIPEGGPGRVELRGAPWNARSTAGAIAEGQRCRVEKVEGLTLWVRPE